MIGVDFSQFLAFSRHMAGAGARVTVLAGAEVRSSGEDLALTAQANAPVLTGELRDSIHTVRTGRLSVEVVADSAHAGYVEEGTSVMAPEPYMGPAADATIPSLEAQLANAGVEALL